MVGRGLLDPAIAGDFLGLDIAPGVGAALVTAAAGMLLAGLRAFALTVSGARERQRALYSEAYKVAMAWQEMLYRVRRRQPGKDAEQALVDRFHRLQQRIDYYEGWLASESRWMGRSYCGLVQAIKDQTFGPIRTAWDEPPREPSEPARDGDEHPDLRKERDVFLTDVRNHLSLLFVTKLAVVWRNREWFRKPPPPNPRRKTDTKEEQREPA